MVRISTARLRHITVGDATGGGHMHGSGVPNASKFPAGWDPVRIQAEVLLLANGPAFQQGVQQPNGKWRLRGVDTAGHALTIILFQHPRDGHYWVCTAYPA